MKEKVKGKLKSAGFAAAIVIAVVFLFSLAAVNIGKAYADSPYFNDFYMSLNGGAVQSTSSGQSISGGTVNLSLGKNYNFGGLVIGGVLNGGYASNGSLTYDNYDGYGDNATASIYSVYYSAAVKAGYAISNFMPFVKLGYI